MSRHCYTEEQVNFLANNYIGRSHIELTDMFNKYFGTQLKSRQIATALNGRGLHTKDYHRYTKEHIAFLKENSQKYGTIELTNAFNNHFCTQLSSSQINNTLKVYKLRRKNYFIATSEHISFLIDNIANRRCDEITDMFNKQFGTQVSVIQIRNILNRRKLHSGFNGGFKKGHAINIMPVGTEKARGSSGYIYIKTAQPDKWRLKHVFIWESVNGSMPDNHTAIFGDGNNQNFNIDNLILVSNRQFRLLHSKKLKCSSVDLTRIGIAVADILLKISEIEKKNLEEGGNAI